MKTEKEKESHKKSNNKYYLRLRADPEKWAEVLKTKRQRARAATPEQRAKKRATATRWRKENPDRIKQYKKLDAERHRDKQLARGRAYYENNKEKAKAWGAARYAREGEKIRARQRELRAANPEFHRARARLYKENNRNAWRVIGCRKSAKEDGVPFDLDKEWFDIRIGAGVCEMSGLPFNLEANGRHPYAPSVDRIIPGGPYTKDNCRLILWWLNRAMSNLGEEHTLDMFRSIFVKRGEMLSLEKTEAA